MNRNDRARHILDYLEENGVAAYRELRPLLQVSEMTVRRDVDRLASEGRLIKTLGGVQKANAPPDFYEASFQARSLNHIELKRAIAQKAFACLDVGESLCLDGSSSCLELAKLLATGDKRVTVVTNSLLVGREVGRNLGNTVQIVGGQYDPETCCVTGPDSEVQVGQYHMDSAYMSTKGLLPDEGTYESSVGLFRVKQAMAAQSRKVVLLVDHSKFGQRALCKVLNISQIQTMITDSIDDRTRSSLENAGVEVLLAQPELCKSEA